MICDRFCDQIFSARAVCEKVRLGRVPHARVSIGPHSQTTNTKKIDLILADEDDRLDRQAPFAVGCGFVDPMERIHFCELVEREPPL